MRNTQGLSRHEREVDVEKRENSGRADYAFRLDGTIQYFVEAKAPHVSLESSNVILQAKKYAWNKVDQVVYFAAVTDFEEFHFYDASRKPDPLHPQTGLIFKHRYGEYLATKGLKNLWQLSRESVAAGSLYKLVATRKARQRTPLDKQFLADLSEWRDQLAKSLFKAHPNLTPAELNNLVQVFLDRLIFMRVAEDRGVLPAGQLRDIARDWRDEGRRRPVMADLLPLFRAVNDLLNGEIFKPHPCETIQWDSALVAQIIAQGLEPYDFASIPVELLGSIYERYLGKVITVKGTRVHVDDKPEVRKAGGVYYTPKYIVDYIVAQTVGKLVEGKTPKQITKLKFLDPACGSGSFLLGAYQYLLDYHTRLLAEKAGQRAKKV